MMNNAIRYCIIPSDPNAHLFKVSLHMESPHPAGQTFYLPVWIPGSYMVREFARNIVRIHAHSHGNPISLHKIDKTNWQAAPCDGPLTLEYEVYAWDLSVRTAHLDQTHGFFNGSSVFLCATDHENDLHIVDIQAPVLPQQEPWRVATSLPELEAPRYGFGTYIAVNYDELIDHPVEMGTFALGHFEACGIQHDVAITGKVPHLDMEKLCADLKIMCESQIAFFEPETKKAPVSRYVFLVTAVGNGYGGLEHRASTALLCSRADLPVKNAAPVKEKSLAILDENYRNFLGLCSHEYFHTWLVKRIKPAQFIPYTLQEENYTRLLWLFEGFTSYYDDLTLLRCGLTDTNTYLQTLARTINLVLTGAGRTKQSLAEASFDAWIKFYRQDENAPNALVNYYQKGALIALLMDLHIRAHTHQARSLDSVMQILWQDFGKHFENMPRGIDEKTVCALISTAADTPLEAFFKLYIEGTQELPLAEALAEIGIRMIPPEKAARPSLNIRVKRNHHDCQVSHVYEGGAAHLAGLSAGDILIAINGLRVNGDNPAAALEKLLAPYTPGEKLELHAFRRDELMQLTVTVGTDRVPQYTLVMTEDPQKEKNRQAWLTGRPLS